MISKAKTLEAASDFPDLMQSSVLRMSRLIDNVMDFARGRLGGGFSLQRRVQPVESMLKQIMAELHPSHSDREIEGTFDIHEPVNCDLQRIGQLFSNLLGNAISHGSPDKPIEVRAGTHGSSCELSVANSGDPIPPAAIEKLFQPFYRAKKSDSLQGLGLGLFIASEIARAHGGTLEVDSTSEETRFTFQMPTK
jgi:phosphoserine phosphatase RsbU/P